MISPRAPLTDPERHTDGKRQPDFSQQRFIGLGRLFLFWGGMDSETVLTGEFKI
jgi:hypothetical protein